MSKSELYYLILVMGAFAAFAVGISTMMIHDRAWARTQTRKDRTTRR